VKSFLAFARKAGFTESNMGAHLRLRKTAAKGGPRAATREVHLSEQEHAALSAELERRWTPPASSRGMSKGASARSKTSSPPP
jgi:hypothetical protein